MGPACQHRLRPPAAEAELAGASSRVPRSPAQATSSFLVGSGRIARALSITGAFSLSLFSSLSPAICFLLRAHSAAAASNPAASDQLRRRCRVWGAPGAQAQPWSPFPKLLEARSSSPAKTASSSPPPAVASPTPATLGLRVATTRFVRFVRTRACLPQARRPSPSRVWLHGRASVRGNVGEPPAGFRLRNCLVLTLIVNNPMTCGPAVKTCLGKLIKSVKCVRRSQSTSTGLGNAFL